MKPNFTISSAQANELLCKQFATWPFFATNYQTLDKVKEKCYSFDDFSIKVQFNPARTIMLRPEHNAGISYANGCPLCVNNLPILQERLVFGRDYIVLCNPNPIFPNHFTITSRVHSPQRILSRFGDMLELSIRLERFILYYGGPSCGTSIPDHAHFQAGTKGVLPFMNEVDTLLHKHGKSIITEPTATLFTLSDTVKRNCFILKARTLTAARKLFGLIYQALPESDREPEPMMNIISSYEDGTWTVVVFPRHPYFWGEENPAKVKLSINPGAVHAGGLIITKNEADFDKITPALLSEMYSQLFLSDDLFADVCRSIQHLSSK